MSSSHKKKNYWQLFLEFHHIFFDFKWGQQFLIMLYQIINCYRKECGCLCKKYRCINLQCMYQIIFSLQLNNNLFFFHQYSLSYACLKLVNYSFFFWLPYYLSNSKFFILSFLVKSVGKQSVGNILPLLIIQGLSQ